MSRSQEIQRKLDDANTKLRARQDDVTYWLKEVQTYTRELRDATEQEAQEASMKKAA